jgi:hypothetical protein
MLEDMSRKTKKAVKETAVAIPTVLGFRDPFFNRLTSNTTPQVKTQKSVASTLLVNASNNEKQKTNQRHVFFTLLKPSLFKAIYRNAQLLITDK